MAATTQDLQKAARGYREIADRHEANGRHRLARNFRAHAADCEQRAEAVRPKTGAQFAKAHENDSTEWSSADFEAEMNFAEMDAQTAYAFIEQRLKNKTAADPGLEKHLAEASLLPPLHTTQPTA